MVGLLGKELSHRVQSDSRNVSAERPTSGLISDTYSVTIAVDARYRDAMTTGMEWRVGPWEIATAMVTCQARGNMSLPVIRRRVQHTHKYRVVLLHYHQHASQAAGYSHTRHRTNRREKQDQGLCEGEELRHILNANFHHFSSTILGLCSTHKGILNRNNVQHW